MTHGRLSNESVPFGPSFSMPLARSPGPAVECILKAASPAPSPDASTVVGSVVASKPAPLSPNWRIASDATDCSNPMSMRRWTVEGVLATFLR